MKLKTFLKGINELIDKEPGALDLEVYYAVDDEGNGHNPIYFAASLSLREADGEMLSIDEWEMYPHASMVVIIN